LNRVATIVLGGKGLVAGELLRLIAAHPQLELAGCLSDGSPGESVAGAFPHLSAAYPDTLFQSHAQIAALLRRAPAPALFGAAPHGISASLIDTLLTVAEQAGNNPHVVDISADFRYSSAAEYQAVYPHAHGAPARLAQFTCAVPEHLRTLQTPHVSHPGCFATAILLAIVPLLALDLIEPQLFVSAVTGSTGSGRNPTEFTHHSMRHGDLYAYGVLAHRHVPEIVACARAATGTAVQLAFVPHSGPFARGIHATVQAVLKRPIERARLQAQLRDYYAHSAFVTVGDDPPRLKDIVASNYARLGVATDGRTVVVLTVLDNLNKGAAGGAVQWMNRLLGFAEDTGLTVPAAGWT
jgi:N-acetyl-gamma-glutamyl-phosphate reductase